MLLKYKNKNCEDEIPLQNYYRKLSNTNEILIDKSYIFYVEHSKRKTYILIYPATTFCIDRINVTL